MSDKLKMFINILKVELEALEEDIQTLKTILESRLQDDKITNYVFQENNALLDNEFKSIASIVRVLHQCPYDPENSFDINIGIFWDYVHEYCKKKQFPEFVEKVIKIKGQKVLKYFDILP